MLTDINLPPLIPDEDNEFGGSLVLDFIEQKKMMILREYQRTCHHAHMLGYTTNVRQRKESLGMKLRLPYNLCQTVRAQCGMSVTPSQTNPAE